MAHLLYVTKEVIATLRSHPAYLFWAPLINNFPIRQISLEERAFVPRDVKVEKDYIYLTVDMKFVYCRDNLLSFLYEDQDLSFRLSAAQGILRTLDNKQFTAVIGRVAEIVTSSEVRLMETDKVFHPYFDHTLPNFIFPTVKKEKEATAAAAPPPPAPAPATPPANAAPPPPPAPKPAPKPPPVVVPPPPPPPPPEPIVLGEMVLGKFARAKCDELVAFRQSSKKSYTYLAEKFGFRKEDVRDICLLYQQYHRQQQQALNEASGPAKLSPELVATIVRMKKVSKKSYRFLADKYGLPLALVQEICNQHLRTDGASDDDDDDDDES